VTEVDFHESIRPGKERQTGENPHLTSKVPAFKGIIHPEGMKGSTRIMNQRTKKNLRLEGGVGKQNNLPVEKDSQP